MKSICCQKAGQIKKALIQLEDQNQTLEASVQARTQELQENVKRLEYEIQQHEKTQAALQSAHESTLEALKLRSQILADVSHDARTPLNVIMLRIEILHSEIYGPLIDKQRHNLAEVLSQTEQLVQFIDRLLRASQLEAKQAVLNPEPMKLDAFLTEIETTFAILADQKGLRFDLTHVGVKGVTVNTDRKGLEQITHNLIGNAVKFTGSGSVSVKFDNDGDTLHCSVRDTGPGIPDAERGRIFEAFEQLDGSMTRTQNRGVGLGLAIVKQMVELMHGELHLQSEIGVGSTFSVALPTSTVQSLVIG